MHFSALQALVAELIKGKILVGHSLWQDLSGMFMPRLTYCDSNSVKLPVLGIPHPAVGE